MHRLLFAFWVVSAAVGARAQTVLVLPFFNQSNPASNTTNLDWIGESISEAVSESLVSEGVLALEREDRLEAFRRQSLRPNALLTRASMIKAGEALDASDVVYGQYDLTAPASPAAGSGGSRGVLHIGARILNLKRFRQGPELRESGPVEDLAALEARLSWQILEAIAPKAAPPEDEFLRDRPHVRLDALESYVRGLLSANPDQQHRFFLQAARLDPAYSQPCFQLGKSYWAKKDYRDAGEWLARVHRPDSRYLEAQFFLGLSQYHMGNYTDAAKCFETVAASVPLNEVYNDLGAAQIRTHATAAIESFRKALEGDSTDLDYRFNLGCALWKAGQYAAAADSFRAVLQRNPNDDEAAALLEHAERREPPRPGGEGHERLKTNYEEMAYRQLKAELHKGP
ncbi:MAG TPA: tetratricopeptide repeat protein [Bryobacteraceae bacterium]|nr:tetratricopeptide repeat protein [Bryobacteraceae bacterium]